MSVLCELWLVRETKKRESSDPFFPPRLIPNVETLWLLLFIYCITKSENYLCNTNVLIIRRGLSGEELKIIFIPMTIEINPRKNFSSIFKNNLLKIPSTKKNKKNKINQKKEVCLYTNWDLITPSIFCAVSFSSIVVPRYITSINTSACVYIRLDGI